MSSWTDDVQDVTIVTPPSFHLPPTRPTITIVGCGETGKDWRAAAKNLILSAWQDSQLTIYWQENDVGEHDLVWIDRYAGHTDYTLIHLGFPVSPALAMISGNLAVRSNVWISVDIRVPETTKNLLNSWAANPVLTSPTDQLVAMIAHRESTKYAK